MVVKKPKENFLSQKQLEEIYQTVSTEETVSYCNLEQAKDFIEDVAKEGIRVNAVSPGVIHTDQYDLSDPLRVKYLESAIPLGRIGAPEEVAEAILWLISEQASYITGTILPVAGGR